MRTLYLIRHAMPDLPLGERWCVGGRSDLPLGPLGRMQAALLPFRPELRQLGAVFCSSLSRARETALPLCPAPRVIEGLEEQDMGVWDGLSFREIRERFPALYAAREKDPSLLPEGAESEASVQNRMWDALTRCLAQSEGDIAVVSHKGAIASLLGSREGLSYTSVTVLRRDGDRWIVGPVVQPPPPALSDPVCLALLDAADPGDAVRQHCLAVAALADELCRALGEAGLRLDRAAVRQAALLHDIAKGFPDHAALGGAWLRELGCDAAAELVRQHTEPDGPELNEAGLVFLADKCVRGDRRVSIEERFAQSEKRCRTPEAKAAHARRFDAARRLRDEINRRCGDTVVE